MSLTYQIWYITDPDETTPQAFLDGREHFDPYKVQLRSYQLKGPNLIKLQEPVGFIG